MFLKHGEFQNSIETIQRAYVSEEGWPTEWFVEPWPHVLVSEKEHLNLPQVARDIVQLWEERHGSSFPWHYWRGIKSSRNLHSSQVLGLATLGALVSSGYRPLERALLSAQLLNPDEVVFEFDFEYEPPNFFAEIRRTSVDFMVKVGQIKGLADPIYLEVKFLEAHFGSCSRRSNRICDGFPELSVQQISAACPLSKEGIRYWEFLPKIMNSTEKLGCPIEGSFYQLARNMIHLLKDGGRHFVILADARAKYLKDEVINFKRFVSPEYRNLVSYMTFQQLVPYLNETNAGVAELLRRKYGIY